MGLNFGLEAQNRAFKYFFSVYFTENQGHQQLVKSPPRTGKYPPSRAIFRPGSSKTSVQIFFLWPFHWKPSPSRVRLESPGLESISQFPGNRPKVGQNYAASKEDSAIFSVLKWSGAIIRRESSKPSVQIFFLCPFYWKPRPSRVSLQSQELENMPQVPGNRPKVDPNYAPRQAVLATFSVLKWSGAIFRPRSSRPSVQIFFLRLFHWKLRPSRDSLESPGLEKCPRSS